MQKQCSSSKQPTKPSVEFDCNECKDTGSLLRREWIVKDGKKKRFDFWRPCSCQERKHLLNRFENALIPDEFIEARFNNYEQNSPVQELLFNAMQDYLKSFQVILNDKPEHNCIGFIAVMGESLIRAMSGADKYKALEKHNSFGLGKTHLQMAAAKVILNKFRVRDEIAPGQLSELDRGCRVLCVSDVTLMEDLTQAKRMNDDGETFRRLIDGIIKADVLIWDDLGKVKWTETREGLYYQIINARYNHKRPIIFSSNEDRGTLSDKIGFAASSRLFGMCGDRLYAVEGADYRQQQKGAS